MDVSLTDTRRDILLRDVESECPKGVTTNVDVESQYDPWNVDVMRNPYPWYARLRAEGGCHELADIGTWVLSTYELVDQALRDHEAFSSVGGVSRETNDAIIGWINEDPPSHSATRAMAAPVFRRSAIARHVSTVSSIARESVDRFVSAGGGEVVSDLAQPIAVASLCDVLGVPNEWPDAMAAMSAATFAAISGKSASDTPDGFEQLQYAVGIPLSQVIESQIGRQVHDPTATVLDMIIAHAEEDAGFVQLDTLGRAVYLTVLVSPGVETTRSMIANAVALVAENPDAWDGVRSGRISVSDFVDEVLRCESPIQGFFRGTTRSVTIGNRTIPKGARVLCLYGSANRDDSIFQSAEVFRPGRPEARRHVAFGAGIHRCIGASLAEAEGVATIEALAATVKRFNVLDAIRRPDTALLRSFASLEVEIN